MKKLLLMGLLVFVMISGCTTEKVTTTTTIQKTTTTTMQDNEVQDEAENLRKYSLLEVSQHNSPQDCWIALSGKVYDVTEFIYTNQHGPAITQGCGIDGTELYETRPMGSGTPHSDRARQFSKNYLIGELIAENITSTTTQPVLKEEDMATTTLNPTTTIPESTAGITSTQVEMHTSKSSCWTIVDGKVYDLTEYVSKHKGGAGNILKLCGKDGSSMFRGKHGMSKDGTLDNYFLADLI